MAIVIIHPFLARQSKKRPLVGLVVSVVSSIVGSGFVVGLVLGILYVSVSDIIINRRYLRMSPLFYDYKTTTTKRTIWAIKWECNVALSRYVCLSPGPSKCQAMSSAFAMPHKVHIFRGSGKVSSIKQKHQQQQWMAVCKLENMTPSPPTDF